MIYVLADGDQIVQYPYTIQKLLSDNPDVSFPREMNDERLAEFGVFPIAPSEPPSHPVMRPTLSTPVYIDGVWTQSWTLSRRLVRKSTITARLIEAGKMGLAHSALFSDPNNFARWIAADRPAVYADDPDALALLQAIGADAEVIMAPDKLV